MKIRCIRLALAVTLCASLAAALTACWDNHELDALFIVTGIALDKSDEPGLIDITLQISKTKSTSSDSTAPDDQKESVILMKTTHKTVMEGLMSFNRNSSRLLLLQHNQVLLIGAALAEEGVRDRMDIFMRNQETRLEVPVIITEGRAEEVLSAKLDQEKVSGVLLSRVIQNLSAVSPCYKVRILDFASMLKSKTADPAIPLISVARTGDKNEIQVDGMAVFKGDKMVGRLGNDDVPGYEWAMGNVEQCGIAVYDGERKAVFHVLRIDGKRKVTLRQDGGARVDIAVEATLNISELSDFGGVSPEELMPYLKQAAREKIKNSVVRAFALTQDLNTDIYGISAAARRRYPRQWKRMGERREALFSECEVNVSVKADIHETGQITKSLEMGEGTDEN